MKRILSLILLILAFASLSKEGYAAPVLSRQYTFTSSGTSDSLNIGSIGASYYKVVYATFNGASSACSFTLQGSTNDSTWPANAVIPATTCTSDGITAYTAAGTANSFVRLNVSSLTTTGTLRLTLLVYIDVAIGSGSTSGTAGQVAFFDTPTTLTSDSDLSFATDTLTFTKGVGSTSITTPLLGVTGDSGIASAKKWCFDISSLTCGDTYQLESSANVLDTYVGGANSLRLNSTGLVLPTNNTFLYGSTGAIRKLIGINSSNQVELAGDGQDVKTGVGSFGIGGTPTTGLLDVFGTSTVIANFRTSNATGGRINIYDSNTAAERGNLGNGSNVFVGGSISDFGISSIGALKLASNSGTVALTIDTSQNSFFTGNVSLSTDLTFKRGSASILYMSNDGGTTTDNVVSLGDGTHRFANIANMTQYINGTSLPTGYVFSVEAGTSRMNGRVYAANLTTSSANQTDSICLSSTGEVIADTQVGGCIVSAKKFKHDIFNLDKNALKLVLNMNPVVYTRNGRNYSQVGFIADEAEKLDSRLVGHDEFGEVHSFDYTGYTAYLTGAIQQLNEKITSLEAKVGVN